MTDSGKSPKNNGLKTYHRLVDLIHEKLHTEKPLQGKKFNDILGEITSRVTSLADITKDELSRLITTFRHDIQDATQILHQHRKQDLDWREWLKFDLQQIERQTLEKLFEIADKTLVEQLIFEHELEARQEMHTGEIKSIGALRCKTCGKVIHFKAPGHIPPCPSCHATVFVRHDER
ncbi:MAG: hypothetical protein D6698_04395 [Gammaproteobacteria bacterium]|nr:MAG: hypothetical protein D6698_04395 [Gammaproteobacteria bacterium]